MTDIGPPSQQPQKATAVLVLADGTVFRGQGVGATGEAVGEVCFNTSITGYQEILTDPSYAGQIITFTFPHIGNVGTNPEDMEAARSSARGFVLRDAVTPPSNWRSQETLGDWAAQQGLVGIAGVDTRRLTRHIRLNGAPHGVIAHNAAGQFDLAALQAQAQAWPGLEGMDLAKQVTAQTGYDWDQARWELGQGYQTQTAPRAHIVAVDFGAKRNILRNLAAAGARVTVVPATTSAQQIRALEPDGVFLSNGPGDPAATADYAVPMIKELLAADIPLFGICLGHQLLALALGAKTMKMHQGHRGANHPVRDEATRKVEITSMNHGFVVDANSLPAGVKVSQISLFDQTVCAIESDTHKILSVQQHPEASPGPQDSFYLFDRFLQMVSEHKNTA